MSASLPNGTKETAVASKYAVDTQLNDTASVPKFFWIAGSAILTEDAMNGVIKELEMATIRAENLIPRSVMGRHYYPL